MSYDKQNKAWYKIHFGSKVKTCCYRVTDNSIKTAREVERKLNIVVFPAIKGGELQRRYYENINGEKLYVAYGLTSNMIQSEWVQLKLKLIEDRLTIVVDEPSTQMKFDL